MATPEEHEARIKSLGWDGLLSLWGAVKRRDTPGWDAGKAFEYLILRAFDLEGARVRWPYPVELFGDQVEQIDGSVNCDGLCCLVEAKDEKNNIAIAPIAKMRGQLLRRPAGTIGLIFASRKFTDPAIQLAHFALPQAVLLWSGDELEYCLGRTAIMEHCERKFRACVDFGIPDFDISYGG